jgi:heme-degrading monooxygenase HmoA
MIAVFNRLPVKEGAAGQIIERFANSRGNVQGFPGFVSMEVLRSEGEDEVLVITRWQSRDAFDAWVASEEFKKAHGRGGSGELLRGHPQMSTYEIAVEREPRADSGST